MNTFKMSPDTLFNLACNVIAFLEETLSTSLSLTNQEIYTQPFLSMLFGQPVYPSYSLPTDANSVVRTLHQFLTGNTTTTNGFSLNLEWGYKNGWGTSNLISSMSFDDIKLQDVKFIDNPFLLFNAQNVTLNLSFFNKCSPE